ncbi:MAG TPA: FMN-binding protein [Spirochaetia bacterium]|nr:FMN-binding protein [Spirochaetia bacterium]
MMKNENGAYFGLLALTVALTALAVVALVPSPAASKPNVLGYRSVCSFAPASSAICGLAAGVVCTLRGRLVSRGAKSARYRPLILPAGVGVILVVIAFVFGLLFLGAQARFQAIIRGTAPAAGVAVTGTGTHSATVTQGEISATVELTLSGGRIERLELKQGRNVEPALAARLFDEVKSAQSTKVDAVSGATASSRVLLSAIEEALRKSP